MILYVVFDLDIEGSRSPYYIGASKDEAATVFRERQDLDGLHTQNELYFLGFSKKTEPGILLAEVLERPEVPTIPDESYVRFTLEEREEILANKSLAAYSASTGFTAEAIHSTRCDRCGRGTTTILNRSINAFGENLCHKCWDDYMHTDKSLVEYVIAIASGAYKIDTFTSTELAYIKDAWTTYSPDLEDYLGDAVYGILAAANSNGLIIQ
jgi:hypothetical protein